MDNDLDNLETSSDDDTEQRPHGGSTFGRKVIARDLQMGADRLFRDYFAETPVYDDRLFRRRFRMRRTLFFRIVDRVCAEDSWFQQKFDALNRPGLSTLQKCVAAIRVLAYGCAYDAVDEYVRIGESTASDCVAHFCDAIISSFGEEYLRSPTVRDLELILQENAKRGFPGMIGSIDCYNWRWKNCPKAWQGSFKGKKGTSIVLEAAVSYDLWFWHAFFGLPGALNDINVVHRSHLLHSIVSGTAPHVQFEVRVTGFTAVCD